MNKLTLLLLLGAKAITINKKSAEGTEKADWNILSVVDQKEYVNSEKVALEE